MKKLQRFGFFICLLFVMLISACSTIKTLDIWKDDTYTGPLQKVLVIALARQDIIRNQAENVLSYQLSKRGIEAIPSHKVLPQSDAKPDREAVLAIVKELGVDSVLVARSISQKEITNHQYGGVILGGTAVYSDGGWYGYSYGVSYDKQYDTDYFTVSTKLYDVTSQNPVWSYISQIKVEGSGQAAVNLLVPEIVKQLEISQLVKSIQQ